MNYQDIHGWFTWPAIYDRMAREVRDGGLIVELGVWRGKSLAYLADKIAELDKAVALVGVDRFDAAGCAEYEREVRQAMVCGDFRTLYQQCRDNLDGCGFNWVELIQSDSIKAASMFADGTVDFLFVDDLHEPEHVQRELNAWLPKLRKPTWIAGDDFSLVRSGVHAVFNDVQAEGGGWVAKVL